jgi:hypothetical protein
MLLVLYGQSQPKGHMRTVAACRLGVSKSFKSAAAVDATVASKAEQVLCRCWGRHKSSEHHGLGPWPWALLVWLRFMPAQPFRLSTLNTAGLTQGVQQSITQAWGLNSCGSCSVVVLETASQLDVLLATWIG